MRAASGCGLLECAGASPAPPRVGKQSKRLREAAGAWRSPRAPARPGGAWRCRCLCCRLPSRRVCDTPPPEPAQRRGPAPSRRPHPLAEAPPPPKPRPRVRPGTSSRLHEPPPAVAWAPAPGSCPRASSSCCLAGPASLQQELRLFEAKAVSTVPGGPARRAL